MVLNRSCYFSDHQVPLLPKQLDRPPENKENEVTAEGCTPYHFSPVPTLIKAISSCKGEQATLTSVT